MIDFGFLKVATALPLVKVADCNYNIVQMENLLSESASKGAQITLFPELSITGYTCADLFTHQLLLEEAELALETLVKRTTNLKTLCVVGMPIVVDSCLYNCAVAFQKGEILAIVPKSNLPTYKEFYEKRWFTPASELTKESITLCNREVPIGTELLFRHKKVCIAIELCEDLWMPTPPSGYAAMAGANVILNLSASNELIGKHNYLVDLIKQQSARTLAGYVYASAGFGESSTDIVFTGNSIIAENGTILQQGSRFSFTPQITYATIDIDRLECDRRTNNNFTLGRSSKSYRIISIDLPKIGIEQIERKEDAHPFVPQGKDLNERCEEIFNIQVAGLAQRILHTQAKSLVIGISGGLDSTLALLVCIKTLDKLNLPRTQIIGVTMPGFGTTNRTYTNATQLMTQLGITIREISIKKACIQHFLDIDHDMEQHDVTYENSQARERTQILMDIANQTGGLVIGTGDLSELALGWATYNGDHMSMYGVNSSIPKTLVRHLVAWVANNEMETAARNTLLDIIDTPISPELIPTDSEGNMVQKTEDLVGPYELHDYFLYYLLRFGFRPKKIALIAYRSFEGIYTREIIKKWITVFFRRFFNQQFKRSWWQFYIS